MTEFCDILKLAELLNPKRNDNSDDEEDEFDRPAIKDLGPDDINAKQEKPIINEHGIDESKLKENKTSENLDPEEEALRLLENENSEINDWRKTPQWDVVYRQQVTPNDVFLQIDRTLNEHK